MPHACVIGLGRSGIAAARVLKRNGWTVTVSDRAQGEPLAQLGQPLIDEGITLKLGHTPNPEQEGWPDRVVVSPGVPWDIAYLQEARQQGVEVMGVGGCHGERIQGGGWQ